MLKCGLVLVLGCCCVADHLPAHWAVYLAAAVLQVSLHIRLGPLQVPVHNGVLCTAGSTAAMAAGTLTGACAKWVWCTAGSTAASAAVMLLDPL